jgi:hypothetical protein
MQTKTLFSKLKKALIPLATTDKRPTLHEVRAAVRLRSDLLSALNLPPTRHNTDRLVTWALTGLSLRTLIRDVDVYFPDPMLADEALFFSAFAAHCKRRRAYTTKARRHECAALLRLDASRHGPLIDALLAGLMAPNAVLLLSRQDSPAA